MARTIEQRLTVQRQKTELARLKLTEEVAARKIDVLQKFDFIDPRYRGKTRKVAREKGKRHADKMHTRTETLQGYSLARDGVRNNDLFRSMINQTAFNAVGKIGGKPAFKTADAKWNAMAQEYMWKTYGRDCDGFGMAHMNTLLKQVVCSALTDGGVVLQVDDFTDEQDGRLYYWTLDYIRPVTDPENLPEWVSGYTHANGLILSSRGKPVGVCIGKEKGLGEGKAEDVSVYYFGGGSTWIWTPFNCAPLLDWTLGTSMFAPCWLNVEGLKEMRSKELDTAGVSAATLMQIYSKEQSAEEMAFSRSGGDVEGALDLNDLPAEGDEQIAQPRTNYEEAESMRGARVLYMDGDDRAEMLDSRRPNLNTEVYYGDVSRSAGAAIGFGDSQTKMKADRSYTAFRGELLMTWRGFFENLQKEIERSVLDRWMGLATRFNVDQGKLPGAPAGYEDMIAFHWPLMPEVDQVKHMTAVGKELGMGLANHEKYMGPGGIETAVENRRQNDRVLARNTGDGDNE